MDENQSGYFIGVDVGSGSVRAGLVTPSGHIAATRIKEISINNPKPDYYQQSSVEIWDAVCHCVRSLTSDLDLTVEPILGIGFDATCSLVILDENIRGISVDPNGDPRWDIIMWMDHRAAAVETKEINETKHPVLDFVGGTISPEMQTPKILWMKRNLKDWEKIQHFFDLSDFLTLKATGSLKRSLCSAVCKWTYKIDLDGSEIGWDQSFFDQIGLSDLSDSGFYSLGKSVISPGSFIGNLCALATEKFGLQLNKTKDIPVAASLIDAHAGALGMLACAPAREISTSGQLGLIAGTSACHMINTEKPIKVPGVWGPYFGVILNNRWTLEGGITAVGSLIDHVINTHTSIGELRKRSEETGKSVYEILEEILMREMMPREKVGDISMLTQDLHVRPDFHGNRSPMADPDMKGMISGLTLADNTVESLARLYLATLQSIAYSTKHILDEIKEKGHTINVACVCGGLAKSSLFIQIHADVLGIPVIRPSEEEAVLLGSAILAMAAADGCGDVGKTASNLNIGGKIYVPNGKTKEYHQKKYKIFRILGENQREFKCIMEK